MPLTGLYVVQMPQCDWNWIRHLHKQQLKAWLSLFFLITSEVVSCMQSSASTTNVCWYIFVVIKALLRSCLCPAHITRHSHPRPLWMRPVVFTKTDGNSIACQGHVVLWSSVLTKHRQMRWYILIGGHKEHQRSARDATHHLYRKPNMRPPTVTAILHGSGWDRALRLPCKVVVMKTNGKPQYVMVGTKQQTDYKRQKSV